MIIWNREVLSPLNEKTYDKNLVKKILKTYNKFLLQDINKVCYTDFKPTINLASEMGCGESFDFCEESICHSYLEEKSWNGSGSTNDSNSHYHTAGNGRGYNSNGGSTICSSMDSQNLNSGSNILNNKNVYDELNSFEFQAQYFIEQ